MTKLLERAISEVQKLSSSEQDSIAALILDELADEQQWQESFAGLPEKLEKLAAKARKDIQSGRVKEMGMDEL